VTSKDAPATGEGKPLKAKVQGRYWHETRPERLRAEQSVKRLRKPEGAAQPGEASPVQVAARFCKRRRVTNPKGGGQNLFGRL
jgi:aryl-alcohol dehydrogenase-like predicted oxidoreductase